MLPGSTGNVCRRVVRHHDLGPSPRVFLLGGAHLFLRQFLLFKPKSPARFTSKLEQLFPVRRFRPADEEEVHPVPASHTKVTKAVGREVIVVLMVAGDEAMTGRIDAGNQLLICFSIPHVTKLN